MITLINTLSVKPVIKLLVFKNMLLNHLIRRFSATHTSHKTMNMIAARIKMSGPITVAEYMKEVLINPVSGYYTSRDVFGQAGDFITSPEISQLFGEMIAIWIVNEWRNLGSPAPWHLVELGPGRGTMMNDILRAFHQFKVSPDLVHLVEMSDVMGTLQGKSLCSSFEASDDAFYQKGISKTGVPVHWHRTVHSVPPQFSCVIAHEFFDALPIHKFQKTKNGWREVLVDLDGEKLQYIIANSPTPMSTLFTREDDPRDSIEVSPQSLAIMEHLSDRIETNGGFMLVGDYGHTGDKGDTFRGFRNHKLHEPLVDPGTADLTADVDFSALKKVAGDKLLSFGPITQRDFLQRLHIDVLMKNCKTEESRKNLKSGYSMIIDEMGDKFKFMSFFPSVLQQVFPQFSVAGF